MTRRKAAGYLHKKSSGIGYAVTTDESSGKRVYTYFPGRWCRSLRLLGQPRLEWRSRLGRIVAPREEAIDTLPAALIVGHSVADAPYFLA